MNSKTVDNTQYVTFHLMQQSITSFFEDNCNCFAISLEILRRNSEADMCFTLSRTLKIIFWLRKPILYQKIHDMRTTSHIKHLSTKKEVVFIGEIFFQHLNNYIIVCIIINCDSSHLVFNSPFNQTFIQHITNNISCMG